MNENAVLPSPDPIFTFDRNLNKALTAEEREEVVNSVVAESATEKESREEPENIVPRFMPLFDKVVVLLGKQSEKFENSALYMSEITQETEQNRTVVGVIKDIGPDAVGLKGLGSARIGDTVFIANYAGNMEPRTDTDRVRIVNAVDLLGFEPRVKEGGGDDESR